MEFSALEDKIIRQNLEILSKTIRGSEQEPALRITDDSVRLILVRKTDKALVIEYGSFGLSLPDNTSFDVVCKFAKYVLQQIDLFRTINPEFMNLF